MVGAIIPWNAPMGLISMKLAPALIAGCTVILKSSPEAPGEGYLIAEAAEAVGLPPGVLNVVTADREVSELLVRDPRVDKITFTGSTAAGRQDRLDLRRADRPLHPGARRQVGRGHPRRRGPRDRRAIPRDGRVPAVRPGLRLADRIVVTRSRHDDMVEALAAAFSKVKVGDPFDPSSQMGPLAAERQRDRVEGYIAKGVEDRRHAGHRRRPSEGPGPRLVRRADRVRQRGQQVGDRAGGDLRPGAVRDPRRRRGRRGAHRQRHDLRAERRGVHQRRRAGPRGRRADADRHHRPQRLQVRLRHGASAASSSPASAARAA